MKKIWLLCLCLASLNLVGCFHIPDEDWLPSKNKVNTWNIEKQDEMDQAINSFMDWLDMISSEWDEMNNNESVLTYSWKSEELIVDTIDYEYMTGEENQEVENTIIEE